MIPFEGCLSFRDLGGYTTASGALVRTGRLFRSMTPEFMTEADVKQARDILGIRLVLDLRDTDDRDSGPLGQPPAQRRVVRFLEMAKLPELRELSPPDALPLHLEHSGAAFAEAISLLAEITDGAALFHCQTGKDRTGVLAAVVLDLLGVNEEDVMADYMLGAPIANDVIDLLTKGGRPMPQTAPRHAKEPPQKEAMQAFLARLKNEYGGARLYLNGLGVPDRAIEKFVADMTE